MNQLIDLLVKHEGVSRKPYTDTTGNLTIGVGRNLDSMGISDDEIFHMLRNDIRRCEDELENAFRWYNYLNDARQDAMTSMCFNLGITRLRGFRKAIDAMELGDFDEAADEFMDSLWAKQVGQRAIDVTTMIRTGEYNA